MKQVIFDIVMKSHF